MEPRVWIVNADHWPRAYLRAELIERGYDATGFEDLRSAVVRLALGALRPALLVVDTETGEISDRTWRAFAERGIPILAVVAAGADTARLGPHAEALRRPLTIGAIADAVERRVRRARPTAPAEPAR
jgi:DNA-binding response OmpR family regulator